MRWRKHNALEYWDAFDGREHRLAVVIDGWKPLTQGD
jgi:hypothetical protein